MASLPEGNEPKQTSSTKYSEELLFSFDAVNTKVANSAQIVKDVHDFFKARAQLEEDYAKKLAALNKTLPGAGGFFGSKEPSILKESKTLKESILSIQTKNLKVADQHQQFATKIQTEICKSLEGFLKSKETQRKKTVTDAQKHIKTLQDTRNATQKAKDTYDKAMKDVETAKDQLIKAEKDEINQTDNKKLQQVTKKASQKHKTLQEKASQQDKAYQESISKSNSELEKFRTEHMPNALDELQSWDDEHWNTLLNSVLTFYSLQSTIPESLEEYVTELKDVSAAANLEEDTKEFVEETKTQQTEIEPLEYVPFKGKYTDDAEETSAEKSDKPEESAPEEKKDESNFGSMTAEEKIQAEEEQNNKKEEKEEEKEPEKPAETKKDLFPEENESLFSEEQEETYSLQVHSHPW